MSHIKSLTKNDFISFRWPQCYLSVFLLVVLAMVVFIHQPSAANHQSPGSKTSGWVSGKKRKTDRTESLWLSRCCKLGMLRCEQKTTTTCVNSEMYRITVTDTNPKPYKSMGYCHQFCAEFAQFLFLFPTWSMYLTFDARMITQQHVPPCLAGIQLPQEIFQHPTALIRWLLPLTLQVDFWPCPMESTPQIA